MKVKASILVMSLLSDSEMYIVTGHLETSNKADAIKKMKFAKYVILQCNSDLTQEVDADAMYSKYMQMHNNSVN